MTTVISKIENIFSKYHQGETDSDLEHFKKSMERYVRAESTIQFIFLGFPCKSINKMSVSGCLPDLGEELAFRTLRNLIKDIQTVYPPGINIHIISEAHCFIPTDCMPSPEEIDAYISGLKAIKNSPHIHIHTLHDFYKNGTLEEKISSFYSEYMPSSEEVNTAIKNDTYYQRIYPERVAFIYHEFSGVLYPHLSNTKRQAASKVIARNFIAHQIGVNRLVEDKFGGHVRLSIHQQHNPAAKKYYINLLPQVAGKGTPWFHIVAEENGELILRKRVQKVKATSIKQQAQAASYSTYLEINDR